MKFVKLVDNLCGPSFQLFMWNQGLLNLSFDDNKIMFGINDYISSMIRQEDFQTGNHKDKIKLKKN